MEEQAGLIKVPKLEGRGVGCLLVSHLIEVVADVTDDPFARSFHQHGDVREASCELGSDPCSEGLVRRGERLELG